MPTDAQIAQAQSNVNNAMDFTNHLHDYLQDVINEVFDKLSEDAEYDPGQKLIAEIMDATFWSIGSLSFPGSGVTAAWLGTFFGAYAGGTPPASLSGEFGDVWARFDRTFLQANDDLAVIHANPSAYWDHSYTDPTTNKTVHVSDLGESTVEIPAKDDPLFQRMTDACVAAFRVALTKQTISKRWHILKDPGGVFEAGWNGMDVSEFGIGFIDKHPAYYLTWHSDKGAFGKKGLVILENFLSHKSKYYDGGEASDDMCDWLFQDDGFGNTTNENGIAPRMDVFCNWGLKNSLKPR
ncbi:hypothetical protein N9917_00395 [Deltaproteobacteria bacterium]|nr:hypothetical protein [Deltaproteobacteria bacterium]